MGVIPIRLLYQKAEFSEPEINLRLTKAFELIFNLIEKEMEIYEQKTTEVSSK